MRTRILNPIRTSIRRFLAGLTLAAGLLWYIVPAPAHETGASLLNLRDAPPGLSGTWSIEIADLIHQFDLDADSDDRVDPADWDFKRQQIQDELLRSLTIRNAHSGASAPIRLQLRQELDAPMTAGGMMVFDLAVEFESLPPILELRYDLFFDSLPDHRGLCVLNVGDKPFTALFEPKHRIERFDLQTRSPFHVFAQFCWQGVWHIWIGIDHILFLLTLILPSVLVYDRAGSRWTQNRSFRQSLWAVLGIVTAFTVAHSITLSLMVLDWVRVPARVTEPAIALSIVVCALNNIRPFLTRRIWMVAFGFGLIHGLGFANALLDLEVPRGMLLLILPAFNLGVELGQVAIVSALFPCAFFLREHRWYGSWLLTYGSAVVMALAGFWFVERLL